MNLLSKAYKEVFDKIEEGDNWFLVLECRFTHCPPKTPNEEHDHIEWGMQLGEDGEIAFQGADRARQALGILSGKGAKFSELTVKAIFTDELTSGEIPTVESIQNLENMTHFVHKWGYSEESDKYHCVLSPFPVEVLEKFYPPRSFEVLEEGLGRLFWKSSDLVLASNENVDDSEIYLRIPTQGELDV